MVLVAKDIAAQLVSHFRVYGPLLERLLHIYDQYVLVGQREVARGEDMSRQYLELQRESSRQIAELRGQLAAERADREAEKQRNTLRVNAAPTALALLEANDDLRRKLELERAARSTVEDIVAKNSAMKAEFDRALRNLEGNYSALLEERDHTIAALHQTHQDYVAQVRNDAEARQRERQEFNDRQDAAELSTLVRKRRDELLCGRIHQLEAHLAQMTVRHHEAVQSLVALEEKMSTAAAGSGDYSSMGHQLGKDALLTPRPNRSELAEQIPALSAAATGAGTTQGLMAALVNLFHHLEARAAIADDVVDHLEQIIARRLAERPVATAAHGDSGMMAVRDYGSTDSLRSPSSSIRL